jgi:hypothetical protein
MLEKLSKMSAREAMISIAGCKPGFGELPRWLKDVADRVGISFRTARSIWNGEIDNDDHLAVKRLKERARAEAARKEVCELASVYNRMAGGMRETDTNFYRTEIDRLERLARIIGGLDRT